MRVPVVGDAKAMRLIVRHVLDSLGFELFGAVRSKSAFEGARLLMVASEEDPKDSAWPCRPGLARTFRNRLRNMLS